MKIIIIYDHIHDDHGHDHDDHYHRQHYDNREKVQKGRSPNVCCLHNNWFDCCLPPSFTTFFIWSSFMYHYLFEVPLPLSLFEVSLPLFIWTSFTTFFIWISQIKWLKKQKLPCNYIAQTLLFPKDNFINSFAVLKIVKRNKILEVWLKKKCAFKRDLSFENLLMVSFPWQNLPTRWTSHMVGNLINLKF